MGRLALVCAVVGGCSFQPPPGSNTPIDTVDALVIPPGPCQMAPARTCSDAETLRECKVAGDDPVDTTCPLGCSNAGTAHCQTIVPAGGGASGADMLVDAQLMPTTLDGSRTIIDGDTGAISMGTFTRPAGTGPMNGVDFHITNGIAVFRFGSLTIDGPVTVRGTHAIALVADGNVTVNALIDARGGCTANNDPAPGPGGFAGGAGKAIGMGPGGGAPGTGGPGDCSGGAGGGHGDTGGQGGKSGGTAGNANTAGGVGYDDVAIVLLQGGSGGGGGGGGAKATTGGGGGGGLQLVSNNTLRIGDTGVINAGGCGGTSDGDGGSGGGAGGTILLEGAAVEVRGLLAVNGGAGGSSDAGANRSEPGDSSPGAATAGNGGSNGAKGGNGGAAAATVGGAGGDATQKGAGGGGAVGFIRLNGRAVTTSQGTLSPSLGSPSSTQGTPATQ